MYVQVNNFLSCLLYTSLFCNAYAFEIYIVVVISSVLIVIQAFLLYSVLISLLNKHYIKYDI